MKKTLLFAILVVMVASTAWATTYYACGTANIDAAEEWGPTDAGACACSGTTKDYADASFPATGDILEANGCTVTINVDPKGTGGATKVVLKNTDGGGFTTATSDSPITITADGTTVGGALLTITGNANANPALTIAGDTTWAGGDGASENAIADTHTVGTVVFGSAGHPVTVNGGTNSSAYGYYTATVSPVSGYINSSGATATGWYLGGATTHTITGNCTGSSTATGAYGCFGGGTSGTIILTGNIINGTKATGVGGTIRWTPTAPADGVTGNYIKFDGGGTAVYCGKNTDDATKALSTFYYIDPTDGTSDQGSASASGGGGAWGF